MSERRVLRNSLQLQPLAAQIELLSLSKVTEPMQVLLASLKFGVALAVKKSDALVSKFAKVTPSPLYIPAGAARVPAEMIFSQNLKSQRVLVIGAWILK